MADEEAVDHADANFVPAHRDVLYDVPSLLGGWTSTDADSYASTLDARTYIAAVDQGLRVPREPSVAEARALHDVAITRALATALKAARPVAIMGGHDLTRDAPEYRLVAKCAAALTQAGFTVVTGGGPGAMEAAHLGASFSDTDADTFDDALEQIASDKDALAFPLKPDSLVRDGAFDTEALEALHRWQAPAFALSQSRRDVPISIGIPTWLYGHEPPTPLAPLHAKYFDNSIREDGLLAVAVYGVLYAPGRAGTLQEIFQDAAQNYYRTAGGFSPMVFLDIDHYWSERFNVKAVLATLFNDVQEDFLHYVSTVDEVSFSFRQHVADIQRWATAVSLGGGK